jgi:invasion protein IalB
VSKVVKQVVVAALAVLATAAFAMTAPAASRTPVTTKGLAPMASCMTPHQAWVWEKAILSVPAIVLVPPRICR